MRRIGADPCYLFPAEFFAGLERMDDGLLMLDAGSAAGLFLIGGGAMHYFLSASTDEGRKASATNGVLYAAMRHAREAGLTTLHLGGGLTDGDSLQRFKQLDRRRPDAVHGRLGRSRPRGVRGTVRRRRRAGRHRFPAYRRRE